MPNRPPTHRPRPAAPRRPPPYRPGSAERGYDARWQRYRLAYLAEHPLCVECARHGLAVAATDVDHVVPTRGEGDPRHYDPDNHAALCHPCHSRKTARDRAAGLTREG